eukprot:GEZU01010458.1.p1 GENE.GEZU01010458.1~~GEZU01010458.1.p1  ORF type:complete len:197 (-),score=4.90 GEZU01010458.1:68-658(-)
MWKFDFSLALLLVAALIMLAMQHSYASLHERMFDQHTHDSLSVPGACVGYVIATWEQPGFPGLADSAEIKCRNTCTGNCSVVEDGYSSFCTCCSDAEEAACKEPATCHPIVREVQTFAPGPNLLLSCNGTCGCGCGGDGACNRTSSVCYPQWHVLQTNSTVDCLTGECLLSFVSKAAFYCECVRTYVQPYNCTTSQ